MLNLADRTSSCLADAFNEGKELPTHERLLEAVEQYFLAPRTAPDLPHKVSRTSLPPIYFQHPGITHLEQVSSTQGMPAHCTQAIQ